MAYSCLLSWPNETKLWLSENFLHLNDEKTERILLSIPSLPSVTFSNIGSLAPSFEQEVKNMGVTFDSCIKFNRLILLSEQASFSSVSWPALNLLESHSCFYQFKTRLLRCTLCRCAPDLPCSLKMLLTNIYSRDHITPGLLPLTWLPVNLEFGLRF